MATDWDLDEMMKNRNTKKYCKNCKWYRQTIYSNKCHALTNENPYFYKEYKGFSGIYFG